MLEHQFSCKSSQTGMLASGHSQHIVDKMAATQGEEMSRVAEVEDLTVFEKQRNVDN